MQPQDPEHDQPAYSRILFWLDAAQLRLLRRPGLTPGVVVAAAVVAAGSGAVCRLGLCLRGDGWGWNVVSATVGGVSWSMTGHGLRLGQLRRLSVGSSTSLDRVEE
jgi:hypothetical protein